MQPAKGDKQKVPAKMVHEKRAQHKKFNNQQNKNNLVKFSRQTQSKLSIQPSIKPSLQVPSLNLIKINGLKQQISPRIDSQAAKKPNKANIALVTKDTRNPLSSNREQQGELLKLKSNIQCSPVSKSRYISSPIQSLFKGSKSKAESESFNTEADKQQLLLLEIKQLKQQNTFLKKKIRDLKKQLNGGFLPEEYQAKSPSNKQAGQKRKKKGAPKLNIESLHLSVNLFFQEIKNLLNSVTQLFRIQFSADQIKNFQQLHSEQQIIHELNEQICPMRKHEILKKFYLKRKLQRLAYEQEQSRYEMLLNIFGEYYTFKEESEKKVVETIDNMIMYTSDLNKWLIEKAYAKRMRSEVQSQKSTYRQFQNPISPPKFDYLKVPHHAVNHVSKTRGPTLSPSSKPLQNLH